MSDQSATAGKCQRLRVPPTLPSPVIPLAARAGRRCFLLEDDRAGVRKRGAEFLARAVFFFFFFFFFFGLRHGK